MNQRVRAVALCFAAGLACGGLTDLASGQIRLASWNISNYTGADRASDIQTAVYGTYNGLSMRPDIFTVQEVTSSAGLSALLTLMNNAPGSPGDWAAAPWMDGADTESVLVYRTSKLDLINAKTIAIGSSSSTNQPRNTYRYDLRAKGYTTANATVSIYSVHMKAGDTSSDNARRLVESTNIRDNAAGMDTNGPNTALPAGYHFIVAGDMNMQSSSQTSYQEFVSGASGNAGRFYDPINRPGSWNNSSTYRMIHTQDPSGSAGMDDRHDQILVCGTLIDGVGMEYIGNQSIPWDLSRWDDPNHSYRCWGNDGSTFNLPLNPATNTAVGPVIAQALKTASTTAGGHLPIMLDLRVPAKVSAPVSVNFGTVTQGSTATQAVSIGNGGNVALFNAAGIANLSYTLSASTGFAAPGGTFNDAAGGALNTHQIVMSTSALGVRNGFITINATGADVPSVTIQVTGTVVAANQAPVADAGADQVVVDSDNSGAEAVTLDGSGSQDPDGTITNYLWKEGATVLAQGSSATANVALGVGTHTITLTVTDNGSLTGTDTVVVEVQPLGCGTSDFNGDGDFGTDADIEAFFACLAGECCATCYPGGSDFNADGDFGTDSDIEAFFRVLGGGGC